MLLDVSDDRDLGDRFHYDNPNLGVIALADGKLEQAQPSAGPPLERRARLAPRNSTGVARTWAWLGTHWNAGSRKSLSGTWS